MSHPKEADLAALIRALLDARVEFIVVGGAAAVLHGAPTTTQDLDIVHERSDENVTRLMKVLTQLDAVVREPGHRQLKPNPEALKSKGQLNLSTNLGPLDPLCQLHDGRGYQELFPSSVEMSDGETSIRVLDLDTLISVKASTGRARDKMIVPILVALRDEQI